MNPVETTFAVIGVATVVIGLIVFYLKIDNLFRDVAHLERMKDIHAVQIRKLEKRMDEADD